MSLPGPVSNRPLFFQNVLLITAEGHLAGVKTLLSGPATTLLTEGLRSPCNSFASH